MFCEKCGADLGDQPEMKFCFRCGRPIHKEKSIGNTEKQDRAAPKLRIGRTILISIAVFLVLGGGPVAIFLAVTAKCKLVVTTDGGCYLENGSFESVVEVQSIEVPEGVVYVADCAFSSCRSLRDIELPESVMSIGDYAFSDCSSLGDIELPVGVTSIGDGAFSGCSSLSSIKLPKNVVSIGDYAFSDCSSISSIELPAGVTSIGNHVFDGCDNLSRIRMTREQAEAFGAEISITSDCRIITY